MTTIANTSVKRARSPRSEAAGPDHPELPDVVAVDLVQRAVAPAVERPPRHISQSSGAGIPEHHVGDGREVGGLGVHRNRCERGQDRRQREAHDVHR